MFRSIRAYIKNDDGVTVIEYGLIAALIAVGLTVALGQVGTNLNTMFLSISTKV